MSDAQKWLWFAGLSGCGWIIYLLSPVLTPFLIAALLAYLGDPMVKRMTHYKIPRTLAVVLTFLMMTLLLCLTVLLLIPLLGKQIDLLVEILPETLRWLQSEVLPWLMAHLGMPGQTLDLQQAGTLLSRHWMEAGGFAANLALWISRSSLSIIAWGMNLVLVPVVGFYLLRDWNRVVANLQGLLPRSIEPVLVRLVRESDEVLSSFLRGQLIVMFFLGLMYSFGLWMIDLKLALLIGMFAGFVSFVPYLGFILGIFAASLAAVFQFGDVSHIPLVILVISLCQAIEGMLLTPILVGDRIGLHPVAVIFAVMAGGQLYGFFGVLLALPAAAVIRVLLRFAHEKYNKSELFGSQSA